jgi:hypothetical protein
MTNGRAARNGPARFSPIIAGFFPTLVSILALLLLLLHVFWASTFQIDQTAAFLLVVVALPWLARIVENIKVPGAEIKFRQLEEQVEEARDAAATAQRAVAGLILRSISPAALDHLRSLRDRTDPRDDHILFQKVII